MSSQSIHRRGVVAVIVREARLLVIERSATVLAPGAYCFPGGGIEAGESEPEALRRELREELSVTVRPIRRLWSNFTSTDVHLAWWLADLPADQTPCPNPAEVASNHWMHVEELRRHPKLLSSNHAFLQALAAAEFHLSGEHKRS